jgi:hypothetical protein
MKKIISQAMLFQKSPCGGYRGLFFLLLLLLVGCSQRSTEYPSVIEIINKGESRLQASELVKFCKENKLDTTAVYEWNKHWVIYSYFTDIENVKEKITKRFPTVQVKLYQRPFYVFDRRKFKKNDIAPKWTNIIMSANLLKDTVKQKEYLEYHRTQFEKWPEVAKGFVNANFQQLLVFRTGRQLMLIISIPKGEKLDELNPKTTENNPRVDEWNAIMSKYQEGIEDAPAGTTWVMFENKK